MVRMWKKHVLWMLAIGALGCGATPRAAAPTAATAPTTQTQRAPEVARSEPTVSCTRVSIHFGYDDNDLSASAREQLAEYQRCLSRLRVDHVRVVGMTDPRGTEEYNLALGARRAHATAGYLGALGQPGIEVSSVGEEMARGADETSWEDDRRADVSHL